MLVLLVLFGFGLGGPSCSNFLASTVDCWALQLKADSACWASDTSKAERNHETPEAQDDRSKQPSTEVERIWGIEEMSKDPYYRATILK